MSFAGSASDTGGSGVATISWNYIRSEQNATHKYYGFISDDGVYWRFKRKNLSTGVWEIADGVVDATPITTWDGHWTDKENKTYSYF